MSQPSVLNEATGLKDGALMALVGKQIGFGCYRNVYELRDDPSRVLKLEVSGDMFCNAMEWRTWGEVQFTKWAKWFAPCLGIDPYGCALLQRRTKPLDEWPEGLKLPSFFMDLKPENFGMLDGQVVCHDYGGTKLQSRGLSGVRLVAVR